MLFLYIYVVNQQEREEESSKDDYLNEKLPEVSFWRLIKMNKPEWIIMYCEFTK